MSVVNLLKKAWNLILIYAFIGCRVCSADSYVFTGYSSSHTSCFKIYHCTKKNPSGLYVETLDLLDDCSGAWHQWKNGTFDGDVDGISVEIKREDGDIFFKVEELISKVKRFRKGWTTLSLFDLNGKKGPRFRWSFESKCDELFELVLSLASQS